MVLEIFPKTTLIISRSFIPQATADKAARDAEDKLWTDDDKNLAKKKLRKEEEDRKKQQLLAKKEENKKLLEEEMNSIKTTGKVSIQKTTRAEIQLEVERRNKNIETINKPVKPSAAVVVAPKIPRDEDDDSDLVENLNRVVLDSTVAATVDEAIAVLE